MKKPLCIAVSFFVTLCFSYTADAFEVTSPAFQDGGKLPKIYAFSKQDGKHHSWELNNRNVPEGPVSLVIITDDPDAQSAMGRTFVHWNGTNISSDTQNIPSVKSKKKIGKRGYNSTRQKGYYGMCLAN